MEKTPETRLFEALKKNPNPETVRELIEEDVDCNLSHFDHHSRTFISPIRWASTTDRYVTLPLLYERRNSPTKLQLNKHLTFYINHHDRSQKERNEILFDYSVSRLLYTRISDHPKKVFDTLIAGFHDFDDATYRGQSLSEGSRTEILLQLHIYTLFRKIIDMKIDPDTRMLLIVENERLHNLETYYFLDGILFIPVVITKRMINRRFADINLSRSLLIKYYESIAKNVISKISQLEINEEYTIPTGWIEHAVCVSFRSISRTYIIIRIDNPSDMNPPDMHEVDYSIVNYHRIRPKILGQLHVDNLQANLNYFIRLIDSVKRDLTPEEGGSLIYNRDRQIRHLEEIRT
jgi:hypothetical protein